MKSFIICIRNQKWAMKFWRARW